MKHIRTIFAMDERVTRTTYLFWGVLLFVVKYLGEVTIYYKASSGNFLTPLNFFSPVLGFRYPHYDIFPDWFGPAIVLWSLPFIWVGVGMSIRRAADAGYSPWWGTLFFIPVVNYLLMLRLATAPSSTSSVWESKKSQFNHRAVFSPAIAILIFAAIGLLMTWFSTNFLKEYGLSLFIGAPLILGLVQAYFLNYQEGRGYLRTAGIVLFTLLLIYALLLLFALEGVICLAMALPISFALGFIGSIFGTAIAYHTGSDRVGPVALMLVLPLMPIAETTMSQPHEDVVLSRIEIKAPPEKVWPNVIKFPDLAPTREPLFLLGVSYPLRARIVGQGVGAVRYCEFSTGDFVEPITTWDKPHRLAFDVKAQPQPMKELSFYDHVDAPHLNGYFRSTRGEFRLVPTGHGTTILEGRTWYAMDIHPGWYWQIYGRFFIHKIHLRVLGHIKQLSEM